MCKQTKQAKSRSLLPYLKNIALRVKNSNLTPAFYKTTVDLILPCVFYNCLVLAFSHPDSNLTHPHMKSHSKSCHRSPIFFALEAVEGEISTLLRYPCKKKEVERRILSFLCFFVGNDTIPCSSFALYTRVLNVGGLITQIWSIHQMGHLWCRWTNIENLNPGFLIIHLENGQ